MYHPTTRVLAVLELLQAHGRLSGADLAARLGVDGRTLRRYIARLEEMGVPVTAERGRHGGYALVAGFKLPPMMFTDGEALALGVGLLAARQLGLADATPAAVSARAKLERVMPPALRKRMRALGETVALDLVAVDGDGSRYDVAALNALSAAAQAGQRVRLRYRDASGQGSARDFDTYGLGYRSGNWYAVGHCHLRGGLRSFRLDRIHDLTPLPASFGRPEGFDALAHLAEGIATLSRAHAVELWLQADLETARRSLFEGAGVFEAGDDGILLHAQVDDLDQFARELVRLPFAFEVLAPSALCDAIARQARHALSCAEKGRRARLRRA